MALLPPARPQYDDDSTFRQLICISCMYLRSWTTFLLLRFLYIATSSSSLLALLWEYKIAWSPRDLHELGVADFFLDRIATASPPWENGLVVPVPLASFGRPTPLFHSDHDSFLKTSTRKEVVSNIQTYKKCDAKIIKKDMLVYIFCFIYQRFIDCEPRYLSELIG
jgi:hypothetical protein